MFALSFFCHSMIDLVLRLVLRHGMLFAAIGIVIGTGASWLAARLMMSLLFATSPTDRLIFVLMAGLLLIVAVAACAIPARRATKIDPLGALRYE